MNTTNDGVRVKKGFFYGWVIVAVLCFLQMVPMVLTMNFMSFFQMPISQELNVDYATYSIMSISGSIGGMVFSALCSKKLGKGNIRIWMTVCLLVSGAAVFVQSMITAIWQLYITQFVLNFAMAGVTFIPINTLLARWFDAKKGFATAIVFAGAGVGGMIFSPILSGLIATQGWRTSFVIIAVIVALCSIVTFFFISNKPADKGQSILRDKSADDAADGAQAAAAVGLKRSEALKTFSYWAVLVMIFLAGMLSSGPITQLPTFVAETGNNYAIVMALLSAAMMVAKLLLGPVFDKFGIMVGATVSCVLMFGSMICFFLTPQLGIIAACIGAVMLGFNCIASLVGPLINGKLFGYSDFAANYGFINMTYLMGCMVGPTFTATIRTISGSYEGAWLAFMVIIAVIEIAIISALVKGKKLPEKWHE